MPRKGKAPKARARRAAGKQGFPVGVALELLATLLNKMGGPSSQAGAGVSSGAGGSKGNGKGKGNKGGKGVGKMGASGAKQTWTCFVCGFDGNWRTFQQCKFCQIDWTYKGPSP